jgi:hypothetical protein
MFRQTCRSHREKEKEKSIEFSAICLLFSTYKQCVSRRIRHTAGKRSLGKIT